MGYSIISVYVCVRLQMKWHVVYKYKEHYWSQNGSLRYTTLDCLATWHFQPIHDTLRSDWKVWFKPAKRYVHISDFQCLALIAEHPLEQFLITKNRENGDYNCWVNMSRDMTKQTKWLCAQRRLRSAWVSAQSDQSLRCPHEESLGS